MVFFMKDFEIANYADDSTSFSIKLNHKSVTEELEISSSVLFTWLWNNYMKASTDKSHLLLSASNTLTANIDGKVIESEDNQILLSITILTSPSINILTVYVKKPAQSLMDLLEYQVIWTFQNIG